MDSKEAVLTLALSVALLAAVVPAFMLYSQSVIISVHLNSSGFLAIARDTNLNPS